MEKVKIVFHPMLDGFGDIQTNEREINCFGWKCDENYYYFFLVWDSRKMLNIPKENVLYVEDIISEDNK